MTATKFISSAAIPPMLIKSLLALILVAAVIFSGCGSDTPEAGAADSLTVTVSIPPLKFLVDRIGGEAVSSQVLLGPGRSPATYEPTPAQMTRLGESSLLVLAGVPYEQAVRPRLRSLYPSLAILDLAPAPDHADPHDHSELDPHSWLDPNAVAEKAVRLTAALVSLDSTHAAEFQQRADSLTADLAALDRRLAALFETTRTDRFYCYHPAYGWLAKRYGLEQVAIEFEGKEPSPARLASLIERARQDAVTTIFVQQQFAQTSAKAVAEAIGAKLYILDPLAENYVDNLESLARAIAAELGADTTMTTGGGE